jgi:hypothetical protein
MSTAQDQSATLPSSSNSQSTSAPLIADPAPTDPGAGETSSTSKAGGKRRLFGFGKKKDGDKIEQMDSEYPAETGPTSAPLPSATRLASPQSPPLDGMQLSVSPQRSSRASTMASPGQRYRSSSPRLHSPASSLIFERNVQDNTLPGELSPAIPSHIQTEDHIPPVLEASSLAITDDHLNPDEVEIVMHNAHQSAAAAVSGSVHESTMTSPLAVLEDAPPHLDVEELQSNYGSLDTTDPRRLSFISFADVVQAEHQESSRDALHLLNLSSATANRSPSPVRSPASSHGMSASPPQSGAASVHGIDAVPSGLPVPGSWTPGSPTTATGTHSPPHGSGELKIETMRQALRKTGSGDLSGARSQPLSATSMEDSGISDVPFR